MVARTDSLDRDRVVAQIDTLVRELVALRRQLVRPTEPATPSLTQQLYGSLGHGTWDEYDVNLDWVRFSAP
jgi:hypothetical protein